MTDQQMPTDYPLLRFYALAAGMTVADNLITKLKAARDRQKAGLDASTE